MMEQMITCINCPVGCRMKVTLNDLNEVLSVDGNTCPRGEKYARQECTMPLRVITAVIPVAGSEMPLSVKTAAPIPKALISETIMALRNTHPELPIALGQVILPDVCGSGVPVIATRSLP